jgi:(S)-ureidoglycine aminohydrolase
MRSPHQLVHSRARVRQRYALFPLEGYPTSRLPEWKQTEARVLAAPALGAQFVQYLLDIQPGGGVTLTDDSDPDVEAFFYVLSGSIDIDINGERRQTLSTGGIAFVPSATDYWIEAKSAARVLSLRKRFESEPQLEHPKPIIGHASDVLHTPFADNPHARLQLLIPDELQYDMAMNIFTFDPGHGLPYVETHVMEHGLLMLEGKGMYYLDGEWMEVEKDDFIWMGPYCPQSFYATGPTPAKYIYYKNVNREIAL